MLNKKYQKKLPLLSVINNELGGVIKWCTPSIHPMVPRVNSIYENDISISYHSLGNPSLNTGIFKEAHELAAKAYKAERTLFSVNGSTGSNFIVFRALKHQLGKVRMLAQRNVHKSVSVATEDYRINVTYLKPHYDQKLQIFVPNTLKEIVEGLKENPETNVVFFSNPTYEGLSLDLTKVISAVRKINSKIIIFVDEAWGAHFPFSDKLPVCAMEAGADICVQSIHKQGSGLQQTSMIHWQGSRIDEKFVMDSYKSLITTSPSFHLLASLDGSRYLMETMGEEIIGELIDVADYLKESLAKISAITVIYPSEIKKKYPQVGAVDSTKVLINVKKTGLAGYEIAKHLEAGYGVVVEKYEADNILFISTFKNSRFDVEETARYLKETIKDLSKGKRKTHKGFPDFPVKIIKKLPSYEVNGAKLFKVDLNKSVGLVCAEDVVPYPPGIPLIVKGEVIQKEHIEYLNALRNCKGLISVVMNDQNVGTILIVR